MNKALSLGSLPLGFRWVLTVCALAVLVGVLTPIDRDRTADATQNDSDQSFQSDSDKSFNVVDGDGWSYISGIWSDGTTMWVLNSDYNTISAYTLATGARDTSKDIDTGAAAAYTLTTDADAGNNHPRGLWSDGTTMWVTDSTDDKVYAYTLATGARDAGKDIDTLAAAGNNLPRGLWSDGTTMWVTDPIDDKIYAYTLATGARDAGKDIDTLAAAGNTHFEDIWSDGTTMWVGDSKDDKIYAYTLATGARDADNDFDTLKAAGMSVPRGLWSNGTTMYVLEAGALRFKVFAFNMPTIPGLRALDLTGIETTFYVGRRSYAYTVPNTTASTTITATAASSGTTTAITPGDADDNMTGHQISLSEGQNTITITGTNGTDTATYTITITRQVGGM